MKELVSKINKVLEKGGYLQEKFLPYLEKYFSLFGEVDYVVEECMQHIGNGHYYSFVEEWLTINGNQILLISSSYDEEEKEILKERFK